MRKDQAYAIFKVSRNYGKYRTLDELNKSYRIKMLVISTPNKDRAEDLWIKGNFLGAVEAMTPTEVQILD